MHTEADRSAVCTLFEGDYHFGVGALVNSLYKNGFRGTVWAGYKGPLPPWASPLRTEDGLAYYEVAPGCRVVFVLLKSPLFAAHIKARFMKQVIEQHDPDVQLVYYFDPDIVTKCRWTFFEQWASYGIALCVDGSYPVVSTDHPWRHAWRRYAEDLGYTAVRPVEKYFNSGFVGVHESRFDFLDAWMSLTEELSRVGVDLASFKERHDFGPVDRTHSFYGSDQDSLNVAVMVTDHDLSVLGTEGMDFTGAGFTMSHAVDGPKPWRKNLPWQLLKYGQLPSGPDLEYLRNIEGPIELYPATAAKMKWLQYYTSKLLGSFFHRH